MGGVPPPLPRYRAYRNISLYALDKWHKKGYGLLHTRDKK